MVRKKPKVRLMKEGLDPGAVDRLAGALTAADPAFAASAFRRQALRGLDSLELKERVAHLITVLNLHLPADYPRALTTVLQAARRFPPGKPADSLNGFAAWPLIDWVAAHGRGHFDLSLEGLRQMTGLFSAEFAVRPFLIQDPGRALGHCRRWAKSEDEHIRRLASEGTRPRLPWGCQLPMFRDDPAPVAALLELLQDDPSAYVRRSVANNLNDIAKDHPQTVRRICRSWMKGASSERAGLVRHALRTLVKEGDPGALQILGFTTNPQVAVELVLGSARVPLGGTQTFDILVVSSGKGRQNLVIDYAVHFRRANGSLGRKVFKGKIVDLKPGEHWKITRNHSFAPRSVRRYHPGEYHIEILVGGRSLATGSFELTP